MLSCTYVIIRSSYRRRAHCRQLYQCRNQGRQRNRQPQHHVQVQTSWMGGGLVLSSKTCLSPPPKEEILCPDDKIYRHANFYAYNKALITSYRYMYKTVLRKCKPPPTPKFQPKVIRDSNLDCQTNPDPHVGRISPNMLWIHYLVGVGHFVKFRKHRAVTVSEMLINLLKSPIPQWWGKWKIDPESVYGTGAPPEVNQFFRSVSATITRSFDEIGALLFQ